MDKKQNKRLGWIMAIIIIPIFIYQFIDTLNFSNRPRPLSIQTEKGLYIKGFITYSELSLLEDSALALRISTNIYEKFVQKYGHAKLVEVNTAYAKGDTSELKKFSAIFDSCTAPYAKELFIPRSIYACIKRSVAHGFDKKLSGTYCKCYSEFLVGKYNYSLENPIPDSLLKSESIAKTNCYKIATMK